MYQILQYLKFLFRSTNQHGVHSPFIYKFVTECLYDKSSYEAYNKIRTYRRKLLKDTSRVTLTDLGAGSRITKSNLRRVSAIAKNSGSTMGQSKLLFRLVHYLKPSKILELGTSLGMSTISMSLGNSSSTIVTIEGSKNLSDYSKSNLSKRHPNIQFIAGAFRDKIVNLKNDRWDLIFFDGDHTKDGTLYYFNELLPTVHNNSIMVFDDIYWSKGMTEAWEEIKRQPKVTVTVDIFFKGIVFFRKEQAKQDFKIRL